MAKLNQQALKDFRINLEKNFRQLLTRSFAVDVGNFAANMVRLRTRLGSGVDAEGSSKAKLKALSPKYVEARKKMKLSPLTSARKSNLTKTGQLLDSIGAINPSLDGVEVGPIGVRKEGHITNEQVGEYVTKGGRPFNNLSNVELKRIQEFMRKELQSKLEKALSKFK
jgi:hypothetical protein